MRIRKIVYIGLAASALGLAAFQTNASAAEAFDDGGTWGAACNAQMTCRVTSSLLVPPDEGGMAIPYFERGDTANAAVKMVLPTLDGREKLKNSGEFTISVDGKAIASVDVGQLKHDDQDGGYVTSDPKIVQPVLAAARDGKKSITVTYVGPDGNEVAQADLSGFGKSVNWVIQQQNHS